MIRKIYISGKITGLTPQEVGRNFRVGKWALQRRYGYFNIEIINPIEIKPFLGIKNWYCYMISDLYHLLQCDSIYMLRNWKESRGAKIEFWFAKKMKKQILYELNN